MCTPPIHIHDWKFLFRKYISNESHVNAFINSMRDASTAQVCRQPPRLIALPLPHAPALTPAMQCGGHPRRPPAPSIVLPPQLCYYLARRAPLDAAPPSAAAAAAPTAHPPGRAARARPSSLQHGCRAAQCRAARRPTPAPPARGRTAH